MIGCHYDPVKAEQFRERVACLFKDDKQGLYLLDYLMQIIEQDDKPYDGLITKLMERSGCDHKTVCTWARTIRNSRSINK